MSLYQAVCFDLFDTIITFDTLIYHQVRREGFETVGLDYQTFSKNWDACSSGALEGQFSIMMDRYSFVLGSMENPEKARNQLPQLLRYESLAIEKATKAVPDIENLFQCLRRQKKNLGIISNSSCIGPMIIEILGWEKYFDELIFSFMEKLYKPAPEIFFLACERLETIPENAVFVSDGDGGELTGASIAGLDTIRFDPGNSYPDQYLPPGCFDCQCMKSLKTRLLI